MLKTVCFALRLFVQEPVIGQTIQDSLPARWDLDSMEIALLRTATTYEQLERVMAAAGPDCLFLNLLPGVLPVDLPINAFAVTSPFGVRFHPIHRQLRFHGGIDVKAPHGLPVKTTAPGLVKQIGYEAGLGLFVRVQHAYGFETVYGHLARHCVKPGQWVEVSDEIGLVGKTGLATGPHLHYCLKKNGSVVDPFQFCFLLRRRSYLLDQRSRPVPASSGKPDFHSSPSSATSDLYPSSRN